MADKTIHALVDGGAPADTDELWVARSPYTAGNDRKFNWLEVRTALGRIFSAYLPIGWDAQWKLAKAAAIGNTGTAKVASIGDSVFAGQSSGTIDDHLLYGCIGRINTSLINSIGTCYAEGYSVMSVNPYDATYNSTGLGSGLNSVVSGASPSCPYTAQYQSHVPWDGGVGGAWGYSTAGTAGGSPDGRAIQITIPQHAITGAMPTKVDLFTIDISTNTWQYQIDAGAYTSVTCVGNVSNIGSGLMRRTTVNLDGLSSHTITLNQLTANGLIFVGHVAYYASTGFAMFRNGIGGWKAADFASGGGLTAGSGGTNGGPSATPDHIKPWSGINDAYQTGNALTGFPFAPDLALIHLGGNDATYGASPEYMRKSITRMIHALRRGVSASSNSPGASILIVAGAYPDAYNDGYSAIGDTQSGATYEWPRYQAVLNDLARSFGCAYIDMHEIFGQTPVANGLATAGQIHPTQHGHGAGGGDGHNTYAQTILSIL